MRDDAVAESADQRAIRAVVAEWIAATKRGDSRAVVDLMTEDAVFLVAGQAPFGKEAFMPAAPAADRPAFDAVSDIKEIHVEGNVAYLWSHLTIIVTPPRGGEPITRAGHTLTVFRKIDGRWLLARDANLLVRA